MKSATKCRFTRALLPAFTGLCLVSSSSWSAAPKSWTLNLKLDSRMSNTEMESKQVPWRTKTLQYVADHKDLKEILRDLAASQNVITSISPQIEGNVTGTFSESPQQFLDHLASSFGFIWYYDGTALYISGANEIKNASISLSYASPGEFIAAVKRLRIGDRRFPILHDDSASTVIVSGPPRYVELVTDIAGKIDRDRGEKKQAVVRVFPLQYGWAADHAVRVDGQAVTIPGVANIMRSMYQKSLPAQRTQAAPQTSSSRLSSLSPKAGEPAANANSWVSKLPGLGGPTQDNVADNLPSKPPLPNGVIPNGPDAGGIGLPTGLYGNRSAAVDDEAPTIQSDPRTNSILIRDKPERMADYAKLIASLDTRPHVLEISASIIDITEGALEQLGIDWRLHSNRFDLQTGNGNRAQASYNGTIDPQGFGNPNDSSANVISTPLGGTLAAVIGGAERFLLARISALEQTSEARITASPKVVTMNNVEAVMNNKSTFYVPVAGYQSAELYGIAAGTSLRVLPMVVPGTDNAQIRLSVHIEDGQLTSQLVGQLPVVSKSEIDTQAMIRTGESLLIAGYTVEQKTRQNSGVPLLSNLPGVGNLFKYKQDETKNFQRLFLLTPRIITPQ